LTFAAILFIWVTTLGGSGAIRPFPRSGGAEEFRGDLTSRRLYPPHHGGAVRAPVPSGGPKWRGKFLEKSGHLSIVWKNQTTLSNSQVEYNRAQKSACKLYRLTNENCTMLQALNNNVPTMYKLFSV